MLTMKRLKIGTKTRTRFPRTGAHKRAGYLTRPPNRPSKFQSWLQQPLTVFAGRFRRLRREMVTKPIRAEYIRAQIVARDTDLGKELGLS